jgi:hypothetical protein
MRTSICKLQVAGEKLNGRDVRITAVFLSDLFEHSTLVDRRCPQLSFDPIQTKKPRDPSLEAFDKALAPDSFPPRIVRFIIDVSGKFVWNAKGNRPGGVIFEKIWEFKRVRGDWRNARL